MKNLILALTLGLFISVGAQNKPNSGLQTQKIESTGNQINQSNSTPPVVTPNDNPVVETRDTYVAPDRRDYDYRNNIDNVYYGRYQEPPTRNEMRYSRGQQCFTEFELNTRPFTLANGYYGAGLELSTSCKSSFLFDFYSGVGRVSLLLPGLDVQTTSGMVGLRRYSKTGMVGRYVSTRARFRSYENGDYYGGNLSIMVGYKANWDGVTLAGEFGLGYQGIDGSYLTLPTWAVTLGYKL